MSEEKVSIVQNGMVVALTALCLGGALIMASCEISSHSSDSNGGSRIEGTVNSFSGGGAFFKAYQPGVVAGLLDLAVTPALAGVAGVRVTVEGTDLSVTTGEDGSFVINGVPEGRQELIFSLDGATTSLEVDVPGDSVVILNDVNVSGDSVSVGSVAVEPIEDGSDDNDNDGADDNSGSDDNANANDNVDDNANTNDNIDDNANANDNVDDNANANDNVDDNANDNVYDNANDNI